MTETMSAGKRRAAVPVDSGVASEGRRRLDAMPPAPEAADSGRAERGRARWFRRAQSA